MLLGFISGKAEAQVPDLSIWNGSLWQVTQKVKGFYWGPTSSWQAMGSNIGGSDTAYGILSSNIGGVSLDLYEYINGVANCEYIATIPMNYLAGSQLDFIGLYSADNGIEFDAGLIRFTGSSSGGFLTNGRIASVGAVTVQQGLEDPGDLLVSGLVIKGKTIPLSKVKCNLP
jgi:hypothetical protein